MVTRLCRVTREGWPGWPDKPRNQDHLEGDTKILLFCAFAVSELLLSGIAQGDAVCPASRDPNQSFLSKIPNLWMLQRSHNKCSRFDWISIYWCNFWGTQTRDSFTWTLKQVTMVTRHNTREMLAHLKIMNNSVTESLMGRMLPFLGVNSSSDCLTRRRASKQRQIRAINWTLSVAPRPAARAHSPVVGKKSDPRNIKSLFSSFWYLKPCPRVKQLQRAIEQRHQRLIVSLSLTLSWSLCQQHNKHRSFALSKFPPTAHIFISVLWWESDLFWFAKILVHLMYWGTQKWWLKARRDSHFQVTLSSESVDDDDLSRKPSLSLSALKSRLILPSYLWPRLRGPNVHGQPNNHFQQCHPMLTICKSNHLNSQPHSKSWSTKQALTTMSNCPTPNFNNNLQEVRYGLLLRSLWANSCATILFNLQRTPRWSRLETRTIFISTLVDCLTNMSQHFY